MPLLLLLRCCCPQILQQPHAELTQLLGKTSGRDVDKLGELRKRGFKLQTEFGLPVLSGVRCCRWCCCCRHCCAWCITAPL